jgi:hypothetical protein
MPCRVKARRTCRRGRTIERAPAAQVQRSSMHLAGTVTWSRARQQGEIEIVAKRRMEPTRPHTHTPVLMPGGQGGCGEGMQEHPRIPRRAARHTCMHPLWPVHRARGALASPRREGPAGAPAPSRARRSSATSFPRRAPRAYPATSASAPTTTVPRARAHLTMICATCSCDARQRHARRTKWSGK